MQIKKQFEEIYALLEANKTKKVSTLLPELAELMSKKSAGGTNGSTFHKIDDEVVAVYCYYHKKWELVSQVEYGKKASNQATGLNTMCKEGVSSWTKQQRMKKLAEQELLTKVSKGDVKPEDIASEQDLILKESKVIVPRSDEHGFDLLADALEAL